MDLFLRSASTEATSEATAPKEEARLCDPNSGIESMEFAGLGTISGAKNAESLVLELHHRRGTVGC